MDEISINGIIGPEILECRRYELLGYFLSKRYSHELDTFCSQLKHKVGMFTNQPSAVINALTLKQTLVGRLVEQDRRVYNRNKYLLVDIVVDLEFAPVIVVMVAVGSLDAQKVNLSDGVEYIDRVELNVIADVFKAFSDGLDVLGMEVAELVFGLVLVVDVLEDIVHLEQKSFEMVVVWVFILVEFFEFLHHFIQCLHGMLIVIIFLVLIQFPLSQLFSQLQFCTKINHFNLYFKNYPFIPVLQFYLVNLNFQNDLAIYSNQIEILQQLLMNNPTPQQYQRKSFLSPEYLRSARTMHSPKFDQQKAHQDHLRRKFIYEEKLARYDQYNSILSAKVKKQLDSIHISQNYQNLSLKHLKKQQHLIDEKKSDKLQKQAKSLFIKSQKPKIQNQNKNLQKVREKNKNLHQKKTQLKSYLKEINSGVSELECILEEVQSTYHNLKKVNPPEFKGLWLMNDHDDNGDKNLKSEKHTKDTVDLDYDRTASFQFDPRIQNNKNIKNNHIEDFVMMSSSKLQAVNQLEKKFKLILERITKREIFDCKIDAEMSELNALEKQIDQFKQNRLNSTSKIAESQKSAQFNMRNQQKQPQTCHTLNKVKSLGRIVN